MGGQALCLGALFHSCRPRNLVPIILIQDEHARLPLGGGNMGPSHDLLPETTNLSKDHKFGLSIWHTHVTCLYYCYDDDYDGWMVCQRIHVKQPHR